MWWTVEASTEGSTLALLPFYVAEQTAATPVSEIQIPCARGPTPTRRRSHLIAIPQRIGES
jgi:hypothetical protein